MQLSDKRVLVTGGSRGIGKAIVEALVKEGCRVVFCGTSTASVNKTLEELKAANSSHVFGVVADVSKQSDVEALFLKADEALGGLDVLINNAGLGIFKSVADLSPEEWRRTIEVNLNGSFYCSREAIPRMKRGGGGYVINISSLAGKNPFAGGAAYNASKFGLNGFSEAMMLDHRQDDIRVSYVMPGSVDTDFSPRTGRANWKIQPGDIAEIVLSLLRMPERTLVSRVEVRPAKPMK